MKIHFIGIGGIGISALAKYYLKKGHQLSGSDLVSSEITEALKRQGAKIFTPHQNKFGAGQVGKHLAKNLPDDADLVIYSPAVQKNNPELKRAERLGIKIQSYPQALGDLTKKYFTIAVSGTHGKSTTVAMIALILIKAGLDPTVIVGTKLKEFGDFTPHRTCSGAGSNCRVGKSKYLVIEADEWQASFLNYFPRIIVLTNIEREHLDYYRNLNHILKTYKKYISNLRKGGMLVANRDDPNSLRLLKSKIQISNSKQIPKSKFQIKFYSFQQKETKKLKKILKVPGEHNVSDALAALTVARVLKIPDKVSLKALSEYRGAWRRFEKRDLKIKNYKLKIISDYAHHPTEIKATLKAAREKFPKKEIWCVFQPHQYQRTFYLFKDFVKVFQEAFTEKFAWAHSHTRAEPGRRSEVALFACNKLIITDIYDVAGREDKKIKKIVSSEKLVKAIKKGGSYEVKYISTIKKTAKYLKENLKGGEVLVIMGAGDIYKLVDQF